MFEERSYHTLDQKGRLAIPTRFRETLEQAGSDCVVLTSYGDCLWGYTAGDWQRVRTQAARTEEFDPDALTFLRCFVSGASKCPLKQNRITIPQNLREDASLQREVVLVGLLNKFEIWDKERWEEEFRRDKKRLQEASRSLKIHMRGLDDAVPSSTGPGS